MLKILCKNGSASSKLVSKGADVPRAYWQTNYGSPDGATALLNWGLFGSPARKFYEKYPRAKNVLTINANFPGNKLDVINKVKAEGIPVPISEPDVDQAAWTNTHWIYKPLYSAGGNGIFRIDNQTGRNCDWDNGYAQQEVRDRKYEVRITAFNWMAPEEWGVWKKFARDRENLTWNHQQGGYFEKVANHMQYPLFQRCVQHAAKILNILGLQFGAIDFIVGPDWQEMFIEINTQPGFTADYGADVYIEAVKRLKALDFQQLQELVMGGRHAEIDEAAQEEVLAPARIVEAPPERRAAQVRIENAEDVYKRALNDIARQHLMDMLKYLDKVTIREILEQI